MNDLKNKVVLITGAAGLQGPEHVKAFQAAGAKVIPTDIKELDVTSETSIKSAVEKIISEYGRIDVLINNAGATAKQGSTNWEQIIKVNLTGTYLCCEAAGKTMLETNGGSIINISSIYGLVGPDFSLYPGQKYAGKPMGVPAAYAASKGGVIALTKYFASLYAPKIRVNCVTPGGIFDNQSPNFVKKYSAKTMLGRMAKRNEISGTLLYLASDLSAYVTGENIVIDGGITARV